MPLIKNGRLAEDSWIHVGDEAPLASGVQAIVSLERWQAERETLTARNASLGLRLKSNQSPELVAEDLGRFDVIALEFPKFTDGRAYSNARVLRERYGFGGELRAVGQVLRDQLVFMLRSGFDAFEVAGGSTAEVWNEILAEISVFYQAAGDSRSPVSVLRRAQREAAPPKPLRHAAAKARKAVIKREAVGPPLESAGCAGS